MKKTLGLALSSAALCFLVACNNTNNSNTSAPTTENAAATTENAAATTATTTNNNNNNNNNNDSKAALSTAMGTLMGADFVDMNIADKITIADFRSAFESILITGTPVMDVQQAATLVEPIMMAAQKKQAIPAIPADFSKAFGTIVAFQLGQQIPAALIDPNILFSTLENTIAGKNPMTREQANQSFQEIMMTAMQKEQLNLEGAGKAFLAENAKKTGVKTTSSGLQYEVIKEGKGKQPTLSNTVEVHYHGTLIDGKVFDSSVERGKPISFPLNGVIQGWQEGVQLMKEGAKYRFYIPHELGYGGQAAGSIPPYSTLIFDVELLKVQ